MIRLPPERLRRTIRQALLRRGLSPEHADFVTDGLVGTSLRGIDTHGIRLLPTYLAELDGGRARARPELTWRAGGRSVRALDAGGALGLVAGTVACREAVVLARENGVGAVSVANSNHFGAASVYTLEMARQGALGLSFTNSDALVAPAGGRHPLFGTNPLSLAVAGADGELFCVDMATSQVAYSKVKSHRERGLPLEPGWALTPEGRDAAIADATEIGALQPLGGYKGQCLGMIVEILCTLLAGMPFDHELTHLYAPPYDAPRQVAHLFLAFDLAAFGDPEAFRTRLAGLLALVREQETGAAERVINPGDLEREAEREREREGIPVSDEEAAFFAGLEGEG
ncbi:MAG TPA: Ldh family oxidoreductase [Thermoanaerobaculia bacterium]|nr:Ldh family oxidoreductase [Thermoanaerobaculia bacterium]